MKKYFTNKHKPQTNQVSQNKNQAKQKHEPKYTKQNKRTSTNKINAQNKTKNKQDKAHINNYNIYVIRYIENNTKHIKTNK